MKELKKVKKILIVIVLLILICTNFSFAIVVEPTPFEKFVLIYKTILFSTILILIAFLIIELICIVIGKISKSDKLLSKSKKICERLVYYSVSIIGLSYSIPFAIVYIYNKIIQPTDANGLYLHIFVFLGRILPLILLSVSLYYRLKKKDKKKSYIILIMYIVFNIGIACGNIL